MHTDRIYDHRRNHLRSVIAMTLGVSLFAVGHPAGAEQAKATSKPPAKAAFDLSYVPTDAPLVFAMRPAELIKHGDVKSLIEAIPGYDQVQEKVGLKPESIVQATYVLNSRGPGGVGDPGTPDGVEFGLLILHVKDAQDWDKLAGSLFPNWVEAKFSGQTYHKVAEGQGPTVAYYAPDERTVILGLEPNLFKAIRRGKAKSSEYSWLEGWKAIEGSDASLVVDVGWARSQINSPTPRDTGGKLGIACFAPLWEETGSVAVGVEAEWGLAFSAVASCDTDAGAQRVSDTVQAVLILARNAMKAAPSLIQQAPPHVLPAFKQLMSLGNTALERAKVVREAKVVRLQLAAEIKLADLAKLVLKAAGAPVPGEAKP
jgi:hypothetical protein